MVLELAILDVKPGDEASFEADFARWTTLEAHVIGFRKSPQYRKRKELLHHYYDPFPIVEHYRHVV